MFCIALVSSFDRLYGLKENKLERKKMNKIRLGGETIYPDRTYSGKRVIELINISFENGRNNALKKTNEEVDDAIRKSYKEGYECGYSMASNDLMELSYLLKRTIGVIKDD